MEAEPRPELSDARRALLERYLRGAAASEQTRPVTIPKREGSGPAPLSYSQQQIWLHSQLARDALIYNEPITIRRQGQLNIRALERSFTEVVQRHEAWRTTFEWRGDRGVQIVQPAPAHVDIPVIDLSDNPAREVEAICIAKQDALQPFDLARGPIYRLRLVSLGKDEHRLYITLHHIIFDGVSLYRVFLPELLTLYEAFAKNESAVLSELPIQYPDYAAWQRDSRREIPSDQLSYWERVCHDLPVLDLPTDRPRAATPSYAGAAELLHIPPTTSAALKTLSQEQNATPFMTMVAAFMTLLHGYTRQEDIVIGGITSGRRHTETMGLLGCFLNTVPIRCAFSEELPFTELLARVRVATLGALSHDEVPFELLAQRFAQQRDASRVPLVQVLIVVEPPLEPLPAGWNFTHMDVDTGTAKFDLQLGLDDRPKGLSGRFIYNTDLFDRGTIELLKSRWLQLLDEIARTPMLRVCDLTAAVWRTEEEKMPRPEWSGTRTDYPRDSAIHELFEEQAARTPDAIALVFGERRLTYEELNRRANQLARVLQKRGVRRDLPVGVCMTRSTELVIGLLAILKADGAYVPLDPTYPAERLAWMIRDTQPAVILTDAETKARHSRHPERSGAESKDPAALLLDPATGSLDFARDDVRLLSVDDDLTLEDDSNLTTSASAEDLAYVIYTSGSTGEPKGVAVPHRAVVRLVRNTDYASFSPNETFLQLAPISFDASTFEIWGPLLNGGKLILIEPPKPTLAQIGAAIREHGVTTLWLTSALFNAMVDERLGDLAPLRQLLAGGDVLSVSHVRKVLRELPNVRLINGYGPTESTTFACCYTIPPDAPHDRAVPIGKAIANTTVHILDAELSAVPIGATGELYIGGDGLARGYWQRKELTAEKFVPDPFSDEPGARLYKTGDLARWRQDGAIDFLGRADRQIKLRGFRIEPGEIETVLKQQPGIRDSAVLLREDATNDKRLVAYVTGDANAHKLLEALRKTLPDYMVPSAIVTLSALPRTSNGKLDRGALPAPEVTRDHAAPDTALEKQLAAIWAAVLGVERVGLTDNFFELGGHSLLGLRLVNQLRESLGQDVPLALIFEAPTVSEMAKRVQLRERPAQSVTPIVAVNRESRRARRS